jgi:hypothetical protein
MDICSPLENHTIHACSRLVTAQWYLKTLRTVRRCGGAHSEPVRLLPWSLVCSPGHTTTVSPSRGDPTNARRLPLAWAGFSESAVTHWQTMYCITAATVLITMLLLFIYIDSAYMYSIAQLDWPCTHHCLRFFLLYGIGKRSYLKSL